MFRWAYLSLFMFGLGWLTALTGSGLYDYGKNRWHVGDEYVAEPSERRVTVYGDNGGSLEVTGEMHGVPQRFYIDTGSSRVVLTYENAVSMGLRPVMYPLDCFDTANGRSCGYSLVITNLRIGEIQMNNVQATILQPRKFHANLLGMTFLQRLKRFEYRRENNSFTMVQ